MRVVLRARASRHAPDAIALFASAVVGVAVACAHGGARLADQLAPELEGVDLLVTGVVESLPAVNDTSTRFALQVERSSAAGQLPSHLALSWFTHGGDPPDIQPGARWQLAVKLKRAHGTLNFAGFDPEAWLFERGWRATGYVRESIRNERLDAFVWRPSTLIQRMRASLRARFERVLGDRPYAGVITALAIGDQQSVPEAQWVIFNRTGIAHLVSISGLHITVFSAIVGALAMRVARWMTWLTRRWPARKAAIVVGALAALVYTLIAGAEVPAQRTLIMLMTGALGLCLSRPPPLSVIWLAALAVVLALDPLAGIAPGFWLSFGAVGLLLFAGSRRHGPCPAVGVSGIAGRVLGAVHAQWVVTVGLTPLTLALFQQVSLVAPLANAVAIPVVTFGVVSLALASIVLPVDALLLAAHAVFALLMRYLEWLAGWNAATWQQHAPGGIPTVLGMVGVAWLVAPAGVPGRCLGWVWMLPAILLLPESPAPERFRATILDVGQGLAAVVQTNRHALLFDAGPKFGETSDAGVRIIVPNLRAMGVGALDKLVVSHSDTDHSGGAMSVVDAIPTASLLSSLEADNPIVGRFATGLSVRCVAGQAWTWDGVSFEVLWPDPTIYDDPNAKPNDHSCVLRVASPKLSLLLTGDIEARDEARLLIDAAALRSDVVVAPHHGSRTSSTTAFLLAVSPSVVAFTQGYRNRFGHPRKDVVQRYRDVGARILRSDADGAMVVEDTPDGLRVATAREARRRYFHDEMGVER